jgi:hypothetical protein
MGGGTNLAPMRSAIRSLLRPQDHAAPAAGSVRPRIGEVVFDIGVMLAMHLAAAVAVSLALGMAT